MQINLEAPVLKAARPAIIEARATAETSQMITLKNEKEEHQT